VDTSRPAVFARPGSRGALPRVPAYALGGMTAYNAAPCHFVPSCEKVAHALVGIAVNTAEC